MVGSFVLFGRPSPDGQIVKHELHLNSACEAMAPDDVRFLNKIKAEDK
jgi:hypothetical protein